MTVESGISNMWNPVTHTLGHFSRKDSFELLQMIFEGPFGEGKEIVDVGSDEIQSIKEFRHFLLKDVRAIAQTHGQTLHLKLPKGKD